MADTVGGLGRIISLATRREVRNLWITGVFAGLVRWTEVLVIGIYTYQQTGSPLLVALLAFLNAIPGALFGAFIGALGERFNRRTLLLIGYSLDLVLLVLLATLAFTGKLVLWQVAVGTFLSGLVWTMEFPVRRTLLGELAGAHAAPSALSFDIALGTATMFSGPLVGGYLMRTFGLQAFYAMALTALGVATLFVLGVRMRASISPTHRPGVFQSVREGIAHLRHNEAVRGVLLITIVLNFFGFSYMSMLPVIGAEKLALGPLGVGVLSSMEGAGALIGLLLLSVYVKPAYFMRLFVGGTLTLLIAIVCFSVTPWFAVALLVLLAGGLGEAGFGAMQTTITFLATPSEMRSRIMGLLVVCIGFGPLGILHTGLMAEWLGADVAIGVIAFEGLAATIALIYWMPTLRRRDAANANTVETMHDDGEPGR